jgi:lysozyme family protein
MHAIRGGSAWAVFGKGWGARVADLRAICHHYVAEAKAGVRKPAAAQPQAPDLTKVATPKAQNAPSVTTGGAIKGSVASATASTAGIAGSGLPDWVIPVAIGVVALVAVVVVIYQRQKALRLNETVHAPVLLPAMAAA